MLFLNKNKISAVQIGNSYCSNKENAAACSTDLVKRLNFFNDKTFMNSFVPYIRYSQFFVFVRSIKEINQDESDVYLDGFDIVTKQNKSIRIRGVPFDQIGINSVLKILNEKGSLYRNLGKVGKYFIIRLDGIGNNYPQTVKEFVPEPTKRIIPKPPIVPSDISPPVYPGGALFAGLDVQKLLVPAGLLIAVYFLMN